MLSLPSPFACLFMENLHISQVCSYVVHRGILATGYLVCLCGLCVCVHVCVCAYQVAFLANEIYFFVSS